MHVGLLGKDVPWFAVELQRCRDELGTVDYRTAADRKQEVDVFLACECDRLH